LFYRNEVLNDYFDWLVNTISDGREKSYTMLLKQLFDTSFIYSLERDENRAHDGLNLRDTYFCNMDVDLDDLGPCSVLEMMIALASRCETDFMYDPVAGDRTCVWFWLMIENLGLIEMQDTQYDHMYVRATLMTFMNRKYDTDGKGGLFYVPGARGMQNEEIWYQMNTWISSIV